MRALITNDDGIESEGLRQLATIAVQHGCDVTVAAPRTDSSGASASLTAVEADGRIVVERRTLSELADVPAYAVSAAPELIALVPTRGAFGPPPDIAAHPPAFDMLLEDVAHTTGI
jgi:5'-nucleotidase